MNEAAEVLMWGKRIGVVSRLDGMPYVSFAYDGEFRDAGLEPAPLMMPVAMNTYSFPALPTRSFHGLPGLLSDSLPDKFGNAVIGAWLEAQGRLPDSLTPIERLCYTGARGMGALEYRPTLFAQGDQSEVVHVDALAELANEILQSRKRASAKLVPDMTRYSSILKVGSSAGGARAKALIGWNEATGEVRSGQVALPEGFGYWLIKFDGLVGNGDKEGDDKWGYGRVEYAYSLMARAAGIEMTECRLWNKRHFLTRRFDRLPDGGKLHAQTLGALAHLDFNDPVSYSYEQAFRVTRRVVNDARANEQLFRRMAFNVLAWNCDDHVKNIAYLMDRRGAWRLAPAYDECYAYNPSGDWTSRHQMAVNGKRIDISDADILACARFANMRERKARAVLDEVRAAVRAWPRFAAEAEVREDFADQITRKLLKEGD
jgi:serine/threonine-protein kinase HipA